MTNHDTVNPKIDDEIGTRLRAFAAAVAERTDTEAAMRRTLRRSRPPTGRLVAIAACFILTVAIAAVVLANNYRQPVETVPSDSPTITTDDGPRTLARGVVEFVGQFSGYGDGSTVPPGGGLAGQTLDINAVEEDGDVRGRARFNGITVDFECVDTTAPDGVVALGGEVTASPGGGAPTVGTLIAVIVREGEPDSATLWPDEHESCSELFQSMPVAWSDWFEGFVDVTDGDNIETG